MAKEPFFVVTVERVPDNLSEYQIDKMYAQWNQGTSASEAFTRLETWAKENDYNGIIGLRFSVGTRVSEELLQIGGTAVTSTVIWLAYGTLVKFK